jgi:dihydropteroate synthase
MPDERMPLKEWLDGQGAPDLPAEDKAVYALRRHAIHQMAKFMDLAKWFRGQVYRELVKPIEKMTDEGFSILDDPLQAYAELVARHLAEIQDVRGGQHLPSRFHGIR